MKALLALGLVACVHSTARPTAYGVELADCTRTSATCEESIACENAVRVRYGREPRDPAKGCH